MIAAALLVFTAVSSWTAIVISPDAPVSLSVDQPFTNVGNASKVITPLPVEPTEIGVICAIDPLIHDPSSPAEVYEDLEAPALYFRLAGLGRAGPISSEKLEDLAGLAEHYQSIDLTVAFASSARWQDARNFKKLLEGAA